FERQIGMQAADDVEFGGAFANALFGALVDLFKRELIGTGCVRIAAEGAKLAVGDANVGGIDVAVELVIGDVVVFFLSDVVGEPGHGEEIGGAIKLDAVVERETLAGEDFVGDRSKSLVGEDEFVQVVTL